MELSQMLQFVADMMAFTQGSAKASQSKNAIFGREMMPLPEMTIRIFSFLTVLLIPPAMVSGWGA